jgi:hypothetical protein
MLRYSILLDYLPTALAYYRKALKCAINTKKWKTEKQQTNKDYKCKCALHRNRIPIKNIKTNTVISVGSPEGPNLIALLTVQLEQPLIN